MRVLVPPELPADLDLVGRVVLRDGSIATFRLSAADDASEIASFFHSLSPANRYQRFLSVTEPSIAAVTAFCDSSDPSRGLTVVAERVVEGRRHIIGLGSYLRVDPEEAEIAFAVGDWFHGRGIATAMLDRMAVSAAHAGFRRFRAVTLTDNLAMLQVFRDSGFTVKTATDAATTEVELTIAPSGAPSAILEQRAQSSAATSMRRLLQPRAVAVVGVSHTATTSLGRRTFDAILAAGFQGAVYPVNAHADDIAGHPCYRSARDLPPGVDLAVLAVPRDAVLSAVNDCAAANVPALVTITAGFAETGAEGRAAQEQLAERTRSYGMRMVGPNCMGVLNTKIGLNASFSAVFPPSGPVAMSSQSGALGIAILALAKDRQIGLSTFVSVGNKADVSSNDLLQYWETDAETSVILLYLESFGNPRRFAQLARRIGRHKPIIAVKAGRTRAGRRAASSHTAALAASDDVVDALFRATGVIRAETIDEMFDIASCLASQPLPAGRRVAIVTNAGGPGILAVDACESAGLTVVEFSQSTRARLAEFLSTSASLGNPVDMVASAGGEAYRRAIETALDAEEADALIVIYTPVDPTQSEAILSGIRAGVAAARDRGHRKPVLACVMAEATRPQPLDVQGERIPAFAFPENAARALSRAASYAFWRATPLGQYWTFDDIRSGDAEQLCRQVVAARGEDWLSPDEVRLLLTAYGFPLVAGEIARHPEEAVALAASLGCPVVAKLSAHDLIHKSDIGAVRTDLRTADDVRQAVTNLFATARIHNLTADGVLIQPMVTGGVETMVGLAHDPLFGPIVGFGLGGTEVELEQDVHFRVAPLADRDADDLIHESRAWPRMAGYRGRPAADVATLTDLLLRVSRLARDIPQVREIDLNPVMVRPAGLGCAIADARVKVGMSR